MSEYRIERATPDVAPEAYRFLLAHHQVHPDMDEDAFVLCWKQQFFGYGPTRGVVLVGRDVEGRMVAHYGVIPFPFRFNTQPRTGGFICQLLVEPSFRKSRLFFDLEACLLRQYRAWGFDFLYGLINIKSVLRAHLSLGFAGGHKLYVFAWPLAVGTMISKTVRPLPEFAKRSLDSASRTLAGALTQLCRITRRGLRIREIAVDQVDEELLSQFQAQWSTCALRNREVLAWRLASFGKRRYRVFACADLNGHRGYIVLRTLMARNFRATAIVDLVAPATDHAAVRALLVHACRIGLQERSHSVMCLAPEDTAHSRSLRASLFVRTPEYFTLVRRSTGEILPQQEASSQSWHLSWYDHDYV